MKFSSVASYDRHSTLKKRSADTNDNFNKVIGNQVAINEGLEQLEVTVGESIEMMSINQFCEEQESSSFLDIVRTNVRKYTTLLRDFLELSVPSDLNSGISLYNILDY